MAEKSHFRPVVEEVVPPPPPKPIPPSPQPEPVVPVAPATLPDSTQNIVKPAKKINLKLILLVTIITAIIVGVVAGGVYVFFSRTTADAVINSTNEPAETLPPAPSSPTPVPSPTPEPVDITDLSVSILNGSGKIGEAGKVSNLLEEDGFVVEDTGNADRYDYEATIIQVSSNVDEATLDSLQSLLTNSGYTIEIGSSLPASSDYDIVITVGQD